MNQPAHFRNRIVPRREFLSLGGMGLGGVALQSLLASDQPPIRPEIDSARPYAARPPHFAPKARRVLMIFCTGALSHVDSFDFKPELVKRHDTPMPGQDKLVTFQGENGNLIKPLWEFRPRGQSGKMTSDLLPRLGELADELCFIHSMTGKSNTHGPAESQMSTGYILDGFPSVGAWVTYALGSENQNLPSYIVMVSRGSGRPNDQPLYDRIWGCGSLPSQYQGVKLRSAADPVLYLANPGGCSEATRRQMLDQLRTLNLEHFNEVHPHSALKMRSPREFRRQQAAGAEQAFYCE